MIWATAVSLFGLGILLRGEATRDLGVRIAGKVIASLGFFAVGWLARSPGAFGSLILVGLACGVAGDVAMLHPRGFFAGLVVFLLGHLGYAIAFATVAPLRAWIAWPSLVPIAASLIAWSI